MQEIADQAEREQQSGGNSKQKTSLPSLDPKPLHPKVGQVAHIMHVREKDGEQQRPTTKADAKRRTRTQSRTYINRLIDQLYYTSE